jgi:hypothetical protein
MWENRQIKSTAGSGKVIARQKWQKPTFTRTSSSNGTKQ